MINYDEVKAFIKKQSMHSKIYIGCDSASYMKNDIRYAEYYKVIVVHINSSNGCKIFGERTVERDFSPDKRRPLYRLMQEVYKASELFLRIEDCIEDREVEVHLDLNPSHKYISNQIVEQAIGYIKGTCNVTPLIKPNSWVASSVADKLLKIT